MKTRIVAFDVRIAQLAERSFIAMTNLGGMNIRGQRADTARSAAQSLLSGLAGNGQNEDGLLALDLALEGTSIEALTDNAQLGDGSDTPTA